MKYNQQWLIEKSFQPEKLKYLFFWGHQPSRDGSITSSVFSQWWDGHPFEEDGTSYLTAEHYMMAGKARLFEDEEMLQNILEAGHPAEAKKFGRMVRNFDQASWERHRCEIVVQGNKLKFGQHARLRDFLLQTKDRIIVEASPRDRIWGIGMGKNHPDASMPQNWRGKNLLGFCLMEVRDLLADL